jgi:hypothetical protein
MHWCDSWGRRVTRYRRDATWPESRRADWRNSVTPTAVVRLTSPLSCNMWVSVVPKQVAQAFKLSNNPFFLLSSLSLSLSLSRASDAAIAAPFAAAASLRPATILPETRSFSLSKVASPLNCVDLVFISSIALYRV